MKKSSKRRYPLELESSLTLASNAPIVTPALQRHLDLHWALLRQVHDEFDSTPGDAALAKKGLAQFHTLYEEYEINLLRDSEYLDWPRFHDSLWIWYIINHIRPVKNYIFYRVRFVMKRGTF